MTPAAYTVAPTLRPLDMRPCEHQGRDYFLLRDPAQLTDDTLLVPMPLALVLGYCDGRRTLDAVASAFEQDYGVAIGVSAIQALLARLDDALMLENERAAEARGKVVANFRQAPYRTPALAGRAYPAEADVLWRHLQDFLEAEEVVAPLAADWARPVGLLSPHIDYARGGPVYAQVWKRAAQIAREADLAILLGTDHYGADPFTLTRQHYATPYGMLPTAQPVVDALAAVVGEEAAFAGELRHRGEHSLELVAVWLHHMRGGQPIELAPILVGGLHRYLTNGAKPTDDRLLQRVIETLRTVSAGRRVLVIASGDLAHVGPAFGGAPLDSAGIVALQATDQQLLEHLQKGDAEGFFGAIQRVRDCNNVCGVAPIYLTLRTLGPVQGESLGYAVCPADTRGASVVTVGGMLFR